MAVLNVTLDFSVNDGIAEEFTYALTKTWTEGIYDSAEGNPAGSVRCDLITLTTNNQINTRTKTFEQWGVPAGATITNVNNLTADVKRTETGSWGPWDAYVRIYITAPSFVIIAERRENGISGARDWTAVPFQSQVGSFTPMASTDTLRASIQCNNDNVPTGTAASVYYDNINFDITYTLATVADSIGTGALQSQDANMSGIGFTANVLASGLLQAQDAVIAGYAQSLPSDTEPAKANTADSYILYADAVVVPLTQFTVRRDTTETASITAPVAFEDLMAGATVISIDIVSMDDYGAETVTELFTGALDTYSTSRSGVVVNCLGAATWPANAVRDFGNVSFITDDANYNAYRSSIDPRFYPGDVGMYGFRRINVNKVTFSVNRTQSFMELSDVGQV